MENVDIIDKDYFKVRKAENDSRRKEDRRVRLTENSKKIVDLAFWNSRRLGERMQQIDDRISEIQEAKKTGDISNVDETIFGIELETLKARKLRYSRRIDKSCRRALKVANFMENNIVSKFVKFVKSKIDVTDINRDAISSMVDRGFEGASEEKNVKNDINYENIENIVNQKLAQSKQDDNVDSKDTNNVIDEQKNESIVNNVTGGSVANEVEIPSVDVSSFYRMTKDQIIQDDLSIPNVETPISLPMIEQKEEFSFVENDDISRPRNRELYETDKEYNDYLNGFYTQSSDELNGQKLYEKVSESLVNDNTTINDLESLRAALEAERNTKSQLTRELEEKRMEAAIAQKEAEEAEKEKQAKIQLVNDELAAYKEENKRLKAATKEVVDETQRKISMRQEAMNYIDSLNQMIGAQAVNVRTSENSKRGK